jgi:excinuclease UvrABC helicase subunit UvrB
MPDFRIVSDFKPTGDQSDAIARLTDGVEPGPRPPKEAP